MKTQRAKNETILENLNDKNALVFPKSAYLDYAAYQDAAMSPALVQTVDETYFARFDSESEWFEAVQQDFGVWAYKTIDDARNDFIMTANRYYRVVSF